MGGEHWVRVEVGLGFVQEVEGLWMRIREFDLVALAAVGRDVMSIFKLVESGVAQVVVERGGSLERIVGAGGDSDGQLDMC